MINAAKAVRLGPRDDAAADPLLGAGGRFVVGFDGSAASEAALGWAAVRAARNSAALVIAGVVDDDAGAMGSAFSEESARTLALLLSETTDRIEQAHPGVPVSSELLTGSVAWALAGAATPHDLVVIGSDKTGYARGRVYGARSIQIAAVTPGPLAVVPSVDLRLRSGVVVAVDDTEKAPALARMGAREALIRRAELILVHAVPLGSGEARLACADKVLAAARSAALEECDQLEVRSYLAHRHPADSILNLARDKALLLIGRSRRPESFGVGGTTHEVLTNANAPVIVVP